MYVLYLTSNMTFKDIDLPRPIYESLGLELSPVESMPRSFCFLPGGSVLFVLFARVV
jgi:hypothetical protein